MRFFIFFGDPFSMGFFSFVKKVNFFPPGEFLFYFARIYFFKLFCIFLNLRKQVKLFIFARIL